MIIIFFILIVSVSTIYLFYKKEVSDYNNYPSVDVDDWATSKIVDITRPKVEIRAGEKYRVLIGFANRENYDQYFRVNYSTAISFNNINTCKPFLSKGDKVVALSFTSEPQLAEPGDVTIIPIDITAQNDVWVDTCFYVLSVEYGKDLSNPESVATQELTVNII